MAVIDEIMGDAAALHADNERLRAALVKFVAHFGPLEDNHTLHEDARSCFRLAREALGADLHIAAIRTKFSQ